MPCVVNYAHMNTQAMTIGERIREWRHRRKLSIAELARATRVTESTIYRLEAEGRKPRSDTLQAIADALDVSADELLGLAAVDRLLEVPDTSTVQLPLLRTPRDAVGGNPEMVDVPRFALPAELPLDELAVAVPDEAAPDLRPDDLVVIARRHDWEDGDLICAIVEDRLLLRRGYHEPKGQAMVVGRDFSDRARISERDVVGRAMTLTRRL